MAKKMFTRDVGSQVSRADALKWIAKFEKERKKDTKSVFYGKDMLLEILRDPAVVGIRFFFARKTDAAGREFDDLVLVGTKEDGSLTWNDKAPIQKSSLSSDAAALTSSTTDGSDTYDGSYPCPPYCPDDQPE